MKFCTSSTAVLSLLLGSAQAAKDDSYYIAGTGNPNVNEKMYWKDAENVFQDLKKFSELYVEYHNCAWSWMQTSEEDNDIDENDYWYMGKIPPMGANVAYSLYGSLYGETFTGCNEDTFINSFYTNTGFTDFARAMNYAGVSGFSSYSSSSSSYSSSSYGSSSSSYTASCNSGSGSGAYGVGCDWDNGFAVHTYNNDACDPQDYKGVKDTLSSLNSAMENAQCIKIYDQSTYSGYPYGTGLELLAYSHSCFYQDFFSPDGICPDPYGKLEYYQQQFYKGIQESKKQDPYQVSKRKLQYEQQMKTGKITAAIGVALALLATLMLLYDLALWCCCRKVKPKQLTKEAPPFVENRSDDFILTRRSDDPDDDTDDESGDDAAAAAAADGYAPMVDGPHAGDIEAPPSSAYAPPAAEYVPTPSPLSLPGKEIQATVVQREAPVTMYTPPAFLSTDDAVVTKASIPYAEATEVAEPEPEEEEEELPTISHVDSFFATMESTLAAMESLVSARETLFTAKQALATGNEDSNDSEDDEEQGAENAVAEDAEDTDDDEEEESPENEENEDVVDFESPAVFTPPALARAESSPNQDASPVETRPTEPVAKSASQDDDEEEEDEDDDAEEEKTETPGIVKETTEGETEDTPDAETCDIVQDEETAPSMEETAALPEETREGVIDDEKDTEEAQTLETPSADRDESPETPTTEEIVAPDTPEKAPKTPSVEKVMATETPGTPTKEDAVAPADTPQNEAPLTSAGIPDKEEVVAPVTPSTEETMALKAPSTVEESAPEAPPAEESPAPEAPSTGAASLAVPADDDIAKSKSGDDSIPGIDEIIASREFDSDSDDEDNKDKYVPTDNALADVSPRDLMDDIEASRVDSDAEDEQSHDGAAAADGDGEQDADGEQEEASEDGAAEDDASKQQSWFGGFY